MPPRGLPMAAPPVGDLESGTMVRKIQKTFHWEVFARFLTALIVAYVVSGALLHAAVAR